MSWTLNGESVEVPDLPPPTLTLVTNMSETDNKISGMAEPGAVVELFVDGELNDLCDVGDDGSWEQQLDPYEEAKSVNITAKQKKTFTPPDDGTTGDSVDKTSDLSEPMIVNVGPPAAMDEDAAAAKIQAIQRGNKERAEIQEQNYAAAKIQAIQRGNKERAELAAGEAAPEEEPEPELAAEEAAPEQEPELEEAEPEEEPMPEPEEDPEPEPEPEPEPNAPSEPPPRVDHGAYVASHRERTDAHNATGKSRIKQRHLQAPSKELHKKSCLRRLQLPDNIPSTPVIVMIGDVASLEDDASNKIQDFYRDGVMRAAAAIDALVIDSGLASGIAAISPRKEYADYCRNICQLGISPGGIEDPLSKYHTHQLVISDFNGWGDRQAEFIKHKFGMIRRLAGTCRVVCVLANNGHTAWGETIEAIRLGIPVIIMQGSGDLANEIIYAKMTGQCYDFNIREVVNSGCIVIFNSECNEADLASLCRLHCTIDILGIQKATAMKEAARR